MKEINQPSKAQSKFFYGYIIVAATFIIQVVMFGPSHGFGVFFKPLIAEFGWSRALISGAFSLSVIVQGMSGVVMGGLNDRLGPRLVLTLCGVFLGLGYLLMSQINAAWQLYLFYVVVIGVGMGGVYVPQLSTVARWFVKRRSVMTGVVLAGGGLGGVIVPPVVTWLITAYGWRNSYLVLAVVVFAIIVLASQFLRRDPAQMGRVPYGENQVERPDLKLVDEGLTLREAVGTGRFWMTIAMVFCFGYCVMTSTVHIVPHATDLGISPASAAAMLAVISATNPIGGLVLGSVADRIGNRRVYIICFILLTLALVWLFNATEAWKLYLFAFVFGIGAGGNATSTSPLVAELFGMRAHGLILGVIFSCMMLGGATGPFLAGYIFDVSGSYHLAFLITTAIGFCGLVLAVALRPMKKLG
ncbi:MFS transporter [Chloroflexota bacterium]